MAGITLTNSPRGDILAVDDTPENLQVLSDLLREHGFKVRPAPNGRLAMKAAKQQPPDLILLDINMPEMNGYEVCEQLKADAKLQDIPVIFISALDEPMDKVRAFAVGGVDYITKPFQCDELCARIETHLRLHRQKLEIERNYNEIKKLEEVRDSLVHMIVHDMRSPLHSACMGLDMLEKKLGSALNQDNRKMWRMLRDALARITAMASTMLDVHRMEHSEMELQFDACDLSDLATEVAKSLTLASGERGVSIEREQSAGKVAVAECDRDLIFRVITNLVQNALKYAPRGSTVLIQTSAAEGQVSVSVGDDGPGIPLDQQEEIFARFGRVGSHEADHPSIGLGLTFCRMAVEAHGGTIAVESRPGHGATFSFSIPASA